MDYPIAEVLPLVKAKLAQHPVVILQAPPGAGKSTILPWNLVHESWLGEKKIIMLEPRKLAARSVAIRMSDLLQQQVGETIGYRVRFENVVSQKTRVEVVTEGILTRMLQQDNMLEDTGLIIFDEFHERSLHADLALALCLQMQQILRPDLKILIMSATLDTESISAVITGAPTVVSEGRQYPVSVIHVVPEKTAPLAASTTRIIQRALREQKGDLLVFLPGTADIFRVQSLLVADGLTANVFPLYGELPFLKQQEAITPNKSGIRKIVLSTSISETSLTIEGITTVIDTGFSRVPRFDPRSGLTRLETVKVTRDAADQRAGRAGRLGPGVSYRMWSDATHNMLQKSRQPEILDADLSSLMLELAAWGVRDVKELAWITQPPAGNVNQARDLLTQLGGLNENIITDKGRKMLRLPTHPRIAHMLLADPDLLPLSIDVASLLEERDPIDKESGADLILRLEALRKWRKNVHVSADRKILERIERLATNWRRLFKVTSDNSPPIDSAVGALIAEAYPERIARQLERHSPRYKLANARVVRLPDHDPLIREQWLAIALLDSGVGEGKIFMAAAIDEASLVARAADREVVIWDSEKGMITGMLEKKIGNVTLSSKPLPSIAEGTRSDVLCDAVRQEGLRLLNWSDVQENWQARIMSLRTWRPDEGWPDVSTPALMATVKDWLSPFLSQVTRRQDFARLELDGILSSIIPWNLSSKLDVLAPVRISVPSGSLIKLNYKEDGSPPVIEVRLQEVFGLLETPTINEGRTKVLLHLLSPGYKPVQVTQDLKSFWQVAYHEVRKEMRMRYPRHHWPEDPWTAEAVRGARRRMS
ncbi:MAG: ATP-dependent helicase HrpB [Chryseolinea sp.]